jgi:glycosyltransferase involved in cell wall biosynthesis
MTDWHVLQVTPRYPPQTGGVETHVAEVAERLVARGIDVTVVTADADAGGGGDSREVRRGVRVRRTRGLAPGGAFHLAPGVSLAVRRALAGGGVDLVHAHNYHSFPLAFAALAAGEAPLVCTPHYHAGSADDVRDRLLRLYRPIGGRALRRANLVVAVSEWERDRLAADFGVDPTVIPNGLDVDRFADATPRERDRPYLLCVGRLVAYKGVDGAIRALSELPEYDLLVAGRGPHREELERVAREAGVADRVAFLGYVPDGELPGLYAGAAAYVTLSSHEAYGMTVAEALAAGTPCVVRERGALADWTRRADCVGVRLPGDDTGVVGGPAGNGAGAVGVDPVVAAVREAVGLDAPADPLATWEDVVDRVASHYRRLIDDGGGRESSDRH